MDLFLKETVMKKTESDRGLTRIEFNDDYERPCVISKSSAAMKDCIWLGINRLGHRMHLTQTQVKELLPYLENFVKTGELE